MIHFVPVKDYRGQSPTHDLSVAASDDLNDRSAGTRGHVIGIVKEHICVLSFDHGFSHGHDAALMIAVAAAGIGISTPEAQEGSASMRAAQDGLLRIDEDALRCIHEIGSIRLDTSHNNGFVLKGQVVAGVRIDSRTAGDEGLQRIEKICHEHRPVIDVLPCKPVKVGVVAIDAKGLDGWMKETINPLLQKKFMALGSLIVGQEWVSDDRAAEMAAVHRLIDGGAEMIVCAGGKRCGADHRLTDSWLGENGENAVDDSQVLPELEVSWALLGSIPLVKFPYSVLHLRTSIFDTVMPCFLAGVEIGQGGMQP